MVLFWYQNKFDNQSDFMKHISNNTIAKNLMLQYYRQKDANTNELGNILNQENMVIEQVLSILRVAQRQNVSLTVWMADLKASIQDIF